MSKIKTSEYLKVDIDNADAFKLTSNKLVFSPNNDFLSTGFRSTGQNAITVINDPNDYKRYAFLTHFTCQLSVSSVDTFMYFEDVTVGGTLKINGFKCDYSIDIDDTESVYTSRVGTLLCAFRNEEGSELNVVDSYIVGDDALALSTIKFYAGWNGANIDLKADTSYVSTAPVFTGLFTVFTNPGLTI